jgi:hypothetical protein
VKSSSNQGSQLLTTAFVNKISNLHHGNICRRKSDWVGQQVSLVYNSQSTPFQGYMEMHWKMFTSWQCNFNRFTMGTPYVKCVLWCFKCMLWSSLILTLLEYCLAIRKHTQHLSSAHCTRNPEPQRWNRTTVQRSTCTTVQRSTWNKSAKTEKRDKRKKVFFKISRP